jgi:hypothetical protein
MHFFNVLYPFSVPWKYVTEHMAHVTILGPLFCNSVFMTGAKSPHLPIS